MEGPPAPWNGTADELRSSSSAFQQELPDIFSSEPNSNNYPEDSKLAVFDSTSDQQVVTKDETTKNDTRAEPLARAGSSEEIQQDVNITSDDVVPVSELESVNFVAEEEAEVAAADAGPSPSKVDTVEDNDDEHSTPDDVQEPIPQTIPLLDTDQLNSPAETDEQQEQAFAPDVDRCQSPSGAAASDNQPSEAEPQTDQNDDFGDFGDFDTVPAAVAVPDGQLTHEATSAAADDDSAVARSMQADPPSSFTAPTAPVANDGGFDDDDFGDFGGFEDAAPVESAGAAAQQATPAPPQTDAPEVHTPQQPNVLHLGDAAFLTEVQQRWEALRLTESPAALGLQNSLPSSLAALRSRAVSRDGIVACNGLPLEPTGRNSLTALASPPTDSMNMRKLQWKGTLSEVRLLALLGLQTAAPAAADPFAAGSSSKSWMDSQDFRIDGGSLHGGASGNQQQLSALDLI